MAQQPFTQHGIIAKQNELYALSDSQLITQCNTIASNFVTWLKANFILDNDQTDYVDELPLKLNRFYGWRVASIVLARGSFSMGALPTQNRRTKQTDFTDSCSADYIPPRNGNPYQLTLSGQANITFQAP